MDGDHASAKRAAGTIGVTESTKDATGHTKGVTARTMGAHERTTGVNEIQAGRAIHPTSVARLSSRFRRSEVPFHDQSEAHTPPRMPASQVSSTSTRIGSIATMSAR